MEFRFKAALLSGGMFLSLIPALLYAHSAGPPPGSAGPPLDRTCSSFLCHNPSSGGTGSVSATFPNGLVYTPGVNQHVVITITDPAQHRWGFQSTVRPSAAPRSAMSGIFTSTDDNTQVVCQDDTPAPATGCTGAQGTFSYIEHSLRGTRLGTSSPVTFEFDWTPRPEETGDLTFYFAANAANGDGTEKGDHIYFQNYTLKQAPAGGPIITNGGVVNSGDFQPGTAPATWTTIAGANLATTTREVRADEIVNGQLPTTMDGVSVSINNKPAFLRYISPSQINVETPQDDSLGDVPVVVTVAGAASAPVPVMLHAVSPAFFQAGTYALGQHALDYSLLGAGSPAAPGEYLLLYGTGFGATDPPVPAGQIAGGSAKTTGTVTVTIGGIAAGVTYSGLTPGAVGLYAIVVQVPDNAPDGDLPVVAQIGGVSSPDGVLLPVKH